MNQLDEGRAVAARGPAADAAIVRARQQIHLWGLTLPDVEPLVFDFGLGDFAKFGEIEFWIANEVDAGYCGKFLYMDQGQTCPNHMHKEKHETFFLTKGTLKIQLGGQTVGLKQGGVLTIEPEVLHSFCALVPSLLLEVSMPSIIADNYFTDNQIPIGNNRPRQDS